MKKYNLLFRSLFSLAFGLISVAAVGQRIEKLIETRTISNHEIVGAEYESTSKSIFILANVSNSNGDGLLIKVNSRTGDTLWSKFVASSAQVENFRGLYISANSLFAYGSRTYNSYAHAFVAKLDFNGDTVWTKHYKSLTTTSCSLPRITINGFVETSTGDIVMVGRNNQCDRAVFLKANSTGSVTSIKEFDNWNSSYYSPLWEFYDIQQSGANFLVSARYGKATSSWTYYKGIWKLDSAGDTISHFNSSFAENSEIFNLKVDGTGNMYLLGKHNPISNEIGLVEKFNSSGVSQWTYSPSGVTIQWSGLTDAEVNSAGDIFISGYFQKQNQSVDQFVVKLNSSGTEAWLKQYGYGDNGYGREIVSLGTNYALISKEGFGWNAKESYGVNNANPPHSEHPTIQVINGDGSVGKFSKTPWQDSKVGKLKFFAYAGFSFSSDSWSNVSLVPVTLASPTGGNSGYNSWNNNYSFEIWKSSQNSNGNGIGTFYFTAQDKNGDLRSSDTLEVLPYPSYTALDQYGSPATAACSGDSLLLSPDLVNSGSVYKWFFTGVSNNLSASKVGTSQSLYVKNKGYYFMREVLSNGDSAQTDPALLNISTDQVQIYSSDYPQSFWVSGEVSDSLTRPKPSVLNLALNKNNQHWLAPVGRYRQSNVQQYYYSAADLVSRGLSSGSTIDEIGFVFEEAYSGGNLEDFKISLKWNSTMPSNWVTLNSNQIVYENYWQNPSSSDGEIHFDITDQIWDGTSALIIQVSYRVNSYNVSTDVNPIFKLVKGTSTLSRFVQANNTTTTLIGNTGSGNKAANYRPLTKFKMALPAKEDTIVGCSSSITISVSNTGYQLLSWNTSSTSASINVTNAGEYSVTMIDGNFCLSYDTVQVVFNPNTNSITASADTVVSGSSVTLTGQNSYLNLWSNGASGNTTTVTSSGDYTLTSINSDGCPTIDTATVVVLDLPAIRIGQGFLHDGDAISGYTYIGFINDKHVYLSQNQYTWTSSKSIISSIGGEFWVPENDAENSYIQSRTVSLIGYPEPWIGIFKDASSSIWTNTNTGAPITFTKWDNNNAGSNSYGCYMVGWGGNWVSRQNSDIRRFYISFEDNSAVAQTAETACDSVLFWTEPGFDSYSWTVGSTALSTTSNEIWASASGSYVVTGVRNSINYNSTAVQLTINESPSISITNKSGTTDLNGTNSITLKANYPAGATLTWLVNGQSSGTNDSIVSNTVGWHTFVATLNGCSSRDSLELFAPVFVSTTGSNTSGDGSLANPYETIQFGIDQASSGGKVYVLPGTYEERILIDKPLTLASDVLRTGDTNAIRTTIIKPGSVGIIQSVTNSNITAYGGVNISQLNEGHVQVVGFSINDFQANYSGSWDGSSAISVVNSSADIDFENIIVSGSKQAQGQGCCNAAVTLDVEYSSNVSFTDVRFKNNGEPSNNSHRLAYLRQSTVGFDNVRWVNNDRFNEIVRFGDNTVATFTNNAFINGGGGQLFQLDASNIDIVFNHVTIAKNDDLNNIFSISGSNNEIWFANSVLEGDMTDYWMNSNGSNNSMYVANSVIGGTSKSSFSTSNLTLDTNGLTLYSTPSLINGGGLNSSSPAIGTGRTPTLLAGKTLTSPSTDLNGVNRPNPAGSNPDAGAFESAKAIGDFDVTISSCGYLITPSILNTSNYLVEWSGPYGFSSFDEEILVAEKGTYVLNVYALDRSDTITKSYVLNNPLSFDISLVKNVCEAVSSSSGSIEVRNMTGGTIFQQGWGDYYLRIYSGTSEIWSNNIWNGPTDVQTIGNRTAGEYIVRLEDATGCYVYDTVEILSKEQRTIYVSNSGSNSGVGNASSPYATLKYAVAQSCDSDTIILEDGNYYEDSIIVNKPIIIASRYILDGDTNHISSVKLNGKANGSAVLYYRSWSWNNLDTLRSQLVGVTVQNAENVNSTSWMNFGGGLSVYVTCLKVDHCVFKDNYSKYGGGAAFWGHGFYGVVTNSVFVNNTASEEGGGLHTTMGGDIYVRNTLIKGNTAKYRAGAMLNSTPYVSDIRVIGNTATQHTGGIYLRNHTASWKNILVKGNIAPDYGGMELGTEGGVHLKISNLQIVDNLTTNGPSPGLVINNYGGDEVSLINSLIYNNVSSQSNSGQISIWDQVKLRLHNSIVGRGGAKNSVLGRGCGDKYVIANSSSYLVGGTLALSNECGSGTILSNIQGVKTTEPYFVDAANGDYRPALYSSLIGGGTTTGQYGFTNSSGTTVVTSKTLTAPSVDLNNSARPNPAGSNPEIGPIELPQSVGIPGLKLTITNNGVCQTNAGSIAVQLIDPTGATTALAKSFAWTKKGDAAWGTKITSSISGLTSGMYYVTVTAGSTSLSDSAEVVTADAIQISNASISANCFGGNDGTLKFSITGGSSFTGGTYKYDIDYLDLDSLGYSWTDPNSSERSANYTYNNLYPGSYRVVVTDKKGCQFVDTVVIGYRNSLPDLTLTASGPVTFCSGETVTLTAATTDLTDSYLWQDGTNFAQITVGNAATWRVTVTDTAGCIAQDSIVVDVKTQPIVSTGAPATHTGQSISSDIKYLGEHQGHHYYINTTQQHTWTQAKAYAESLGGHLWVINDANEQSAVNGFINAQPNWYGEAFCGAYYENGTWKWVNGDPFSYTNWYGNTATNNNDTRIRVQFNWGGQWERWGYEWYDQKYIIEFPTSALALNAIETHCDSITVWAPEGFDAYSWSDPNTGTVFGTDRTLKVTSSMTVKVTTTLNKTDNTSCQMESQNYTININNSPVGQIVNHSGTLDLLGGDTVTLGANYTSGSTIAWFESGVTTSLGGNDTLLVTSPATYVLSVTNTGCETRDSVRIDEPIFVATTGSNTTGDGSLANPYKTIQHGINQAPDKGKVYVLPGTYTERIILDRSVKVYSDAVRLGNANAVATTIIKPGTDGSVTSVLDSNGNNTSYGLINIKGVSGKNIELKGFTVKNHNGTAYWPEAGFGAITVWNAYSTNVLFEDIVIRDNSPTQCCQEGSILTIRDNNNYGEGVIRFENVQFLNNYSTSTEIHRFAWIHNSDVVFSNVLWKDNGARYRLIKIQDNSDVDFINNAFENNNKHYNEYGIISLNSNSTADVIGSTFGANSQSANGRVFVFEGSSNNAFRLINSVVEDRLGQTQMVYLPGGSNNSFTARNSVIPGWANNETYSALLMDVDSTNTTQSASLTTAKKLNNNSPAIGLARANVTVGSTLYTMPSTDLAGNARPNPAGSNPDAGAYENAKAVGDFDVTITSCGYVITPSILNSNNYLVQWYGPNGYSSFDEEIFAPRKGLYTLKVFSLDRNDTITKTFNLNNPLDFDIILSKDVCEAVSTTSGKIQWGNVTGGTDNNDPNNWWANRTWILDGSGNNFTGDWWIGTDGQNWQNTRDGLNAGTYVVQVIDGAGCIVSDTVTLDSKLGRKWYVSTSGSNSNSGTELSPLRSVQLAYDLACDQDTIIIEDGTYYENLEFGNAWQNNNNWQYAKPITLASRYILDGQASHIDSVILNGSDEAPVLSARFNGSTDSSSSNVIRLVGMTITRGNAISYNWWGGNRGGGIALFERGYVLENLKVRNNSSSEYGGGIFIEESAILRNVDVYNNSAQKGAGIYLWNISELNWENVNVFENTSSEWAGGVGIQGSMTSDITISGMNIYNNQNTGWNGASALQIESSGSGTLTLNNFQITSNTNINSDSWGAVYVSNGANKGVVFENALIALNKGGWISGVNIQNSADVSFVNSTIYKNLSRAGYTGTYANSSIYLSNNSELNLYNSILGGQTGYNIIFDQANNSWGGADCDVNIKNSLIQGGTSSSSILTTPGVPGQVTDSAMLVEPVYLKNPGQGDFSLAVMSSAIGSADTNMSWLNPGSINNPVYLNMPPQDLYGQSRPNPVGSNADLGAIESELSTAQFGVAFEITTNPACNPSAAQIKATAKHPNGGPYKYLWVSLDGNTVNNPNSQLTSGAYTISNLYAGWYKLTVEKYSGSNVVETYVDSVEITQDAPIVLNLDKSNENCENENNGALQVDVEGGSGRYFITWTYPGGISNANAPSTISGLAPGNYSVTVTDDRGCTAQDTAVILTEHPTPVITITSSIAKPGSTLNGNDEVRMCVGDIVTLDAGGGFADYNWTSLNVSANQYTTRTIEAFESETYYLSVVDSFGCANADTARVYVVYPPVVYASNLNVATGANLQGVTTTVMGNNESITDGPWNNNPWNSDPHPYGSNQRYGKVQFVIRASELYQSGLTQNTNINSLSMYVEQSGSSALSNMTISMGHTGQSAMTNWETGLQQVFTINNYFPVSGTWNIHNFANEFKWDGAQNILVEVCFDYGANNPSSVEILKHQIYGNVQLSMSSHSDVNADNCLLPGNTQYSIWRPNVQLGIDKIQAVDTIRVCDFSVLNTAPIYDTYRWYVNGSQIPDTTLITVANTATSVLRVSDAASGCILWSDTIVVAVDSTSSLNITSDLPLSGTYCLGDTLTLSTNKSFAQYFWSNGSTVQQQLVSRSETFVLRAVSENGCASFDTASVIINVPPDVYFRLNGRVLASTDQSLVYNSGGANCTEVRYVPSEDLFDAGWDTTTFINNLTYQSVVSKMDSLLYPWVVDHSQPKDWILHRDTTDTQFSGPNTDATSADGHGGYLLFNPYQGTDENKTAAIVSPCVNLLGTNQPAMVFNYHMYTNINALGGGSATAQQMGSLKVEVQDVTAGETGWTMVWMRDTPTSTDVWVTDTADLSAYAGHSVKLRLKAQAGTGGPNGEIAVDGISFTDLNPSNPVLNRLTPETVCEGDILEAGSSDVLSSSMSYVWNTGGTGATLTLHTTGWYSVTLLDSNNCEISTDSVYVLVNPEPVSNLTVSASDTLQYCEGQLANVVLQVPGGFAEYAWYLNGGLENTSTDTLNTGILAVGGYSYTAIITDSIGCTSTSAPIGIDVRALPSLQASVTDANCYGDTNGVVSLTVTGNGGYSFIWSNGDTTATILNLGADTLTVFVTDSFSCESTIDVVVNQPTAIAATTSQSDVDCFGGNNGSITVSASGGSGPYIVDWTSATGTSSGDVAVSFQVNMGGQTWIGDIELFVQSFGTHIMTDFAGDSIYRKTLTFMPGDTIFYRYAKSSVPENVPSSCGIITGSTLLQRYVVIPSKDTTLSIVCFASCTDCDGAVRGNANGAFMTTARSLNGLTAGVYTFNMVDLKGCPQSVTDTVDQPSLLVTVVDTIYDATCPQNNDGGVELHATGGVAPYNYQWSNGSSQNNQLFLYAGMYSVLITDMNGCTDSSSFILDAPQPFGQQEICVLSVDSLTGKNLIVWEHTPGYRTSDYVLFKENSQGQFVQIGTQAYTNMSIYTDVTSIPQQQPDRYRIAVMDSCGTMSDTSDLHRTIHLQSNIGSGGEINLIWTPYEGRSVQTYEIFRWITSGNLVQIGSVSGGTTTFTDLNPPVAPNVYYVINAVFNGDACSPTLGKTTAFEGSKSNILNQTGIGTPELPWRGRVLLYPNPSTGNFRIEVPTDEEYQVVIYNAVGKRLLVKSYMDTAEINLENVAEGLYYVEIQQEGSVMSIEKINIVH